MMSVTETPKEVVYCNHCGTANPPRSPVCCNCGHVHARVIAVSPETKSVIVVEQWFWIAHRRCGAPIWYGCKRRPTRAHLRIVGDSSCHRCRAWEWKLGKVEQVVSRRGFDIACNALHRSTIQPDSLTVKLSHKLPGRLTGNFE